MSEASGDRRVRRTRKQLREALVALVLERGWDAVSVLDVCGRADVGRSTFYAHFADKEDLLLSGFDDLHAALDGERRGGAAPFAFAATLLLHAAENQDLFRAVAGRQSGQQIQWRFRDVVTSLVDAELDAIPKAARTAPVRFIAGGFVEMMVGWLEGPRHVSHSDIASAFLRFATAVLKAG